MLSKSDGSHLPCESVSVRAGEMTVTNLVILEASHPEKPEMLTWRMSRKELGLDRCHDRRQEEIVLGALDHEEEPP